MHLSNATHSLCSVRIDHQLYGVDITAVCEILGPSSLRSVPCAPHFIGGLVTYRGEVLTTVSLRALFGLAPHTTAPSVLVVDGDSGTFGLLVDEVREVVQVHPQNFEPVPSTLSPQRGLLLQGAYKLPLGLLIQLDTKRLDPMALMQHLHDAAA